MGKNLFLEEQDKLLAEFFIATQWTWIFETLLGEVHGKLEKILWIFLYDTWYTPAIHYIEKNAEWNCT